MEETSLWKRFILKVTSVKTWVIIFINILFAFIVVTNKTEFKEIAYAILTADLGYFGFNVLQKKLEK